MKKRPSEPNPVGQLRELREGYIAERHGHRRRQLDYMVAAFRSYLKLKDSPGRIKSFYEAAQVRQKRRGKQPNLLTEIMVYLAAATGESARKLAWKRARVLEFLDAKRVPPDKMLSKIQKYGGIERAYRATTHRSTKSGLSGKGTIFGRAPLTKKAELGGRVVDHSADRAITPHKPAKSEASEGQNDKFTTVLARIRYSDLDELKEKELDTKLRLSAVRAAKNGCLIRITCVSEREADW
ncbi:hypothetical protein ABH999_004380 [Bradyrhizobium yuanmingense]|uniref:hypothetical protein n=1 Tax=Bradyrhizobium yuanmingense TaxID=108015 RepID=UPI003513C465